MAASPAPTTPPSPADTMSTYNAVDAWVRGGLGVGSSDKERDELLARYTKPIPPATGACVTLRLHGEVIGRGIGQAFWTSQTTEGAAQSGKLVVGRATTEALAQATPRLPVPNDLSRDDAIKQLAPEVMISLELAGPLKLVKFDTWAELDTSLNPGLDGLVVSVMKPGGAEKGLEFGATRVKFPSEMMMTGLLPQKALRGMIAAALGEGGAAAAAESPRDLREKHAVRMWTFRVSHFAQAAPRQQPIFLYRGARTIATSEMTIAELKAMANSLASHLRSRANESDERLLPFGHYQPWIGKYDAGTKSSEQLFLAAAALQMATTNPAVSRDWQPDNFNRIQPEWTSAQDVLFVKISSTCFPNGKARALTLGRANAVTQIAVEEAATGAPSPNRDAYQQHLANLRWEKLTSAERSLLLYAASAYPPQLRPELVNHVNTLLRRMFAEALTEQLPGYMPWLGWAEVNCADFKSASLAKPIDIPSAIALREMRAQCWKHQLGFTEIDDDSADMLGGIMFTKSAGTPLPTWQCVRPIAFIATMLGDDRLTEPAERPQETFRLIQSLRFLRQLQADDSCGWMYPDPSKAIGGIRAAPWDHTMPPDATSLTLMAVCEAIKSLEKLEAEKKAETK